MEILLLVAGVLAMGGALLLVPLGLPGNWIMLVVVGVAAVAGEVRVVVLGGLVIVAGVAEVLEFLLVKRFSDRYGGSRRAFWGAVAGGIVGALAGSPVPVVGTLLAGVAGTFLGAAGAAVWERRHVREAARIGWGATLGRIAAVAVKTSAGVVILVVGGAALLAG